MGGNPSGYALSLPPGHTGHCEGDCEACEAFREFADPRALRTSEIPYETMREIVDGGLR